VKILVDTHCWLWLTASPERLSESARAQVDDPSTELFLSAASAWEMAIECGLGMLKLPDRPAAYLMKYLAETRTAPRPITIEHAARVADLPEHHRDPFDRLLVAQAQIDALSILTADPQISRYDVTVIDA